MNTKHRNDQIVISDKQALSLFISVMVTLVVFGIALVSDIGWLWSFLAAYGALYWFRIILEYGNKGYF